ncbi:hypothetical protein P7C70_g5577, partial [Phenoliferia sp. Uapishka_3]
MPSSTAEVLKKWLGLGADPSLLSLSVSLVTRALIFLCPFPSRFDTCPSILSRPPLLSRSSRFSLHRRTAFFHSSAQSRSPEQAFRHTSSHLSSPQLTSAQDLDPRLRPPINNRGRTSHSPTSLSPVEHPPHHIFSITNMHATLSLLSLLSATSSLVLAAHLDVPLAGGLSPRAPFNHESLALKRERRAEAVGAGLKLTKLKRSCKKGDSKKVKKHHAATTPIVEAAATSTSSSSATASTPSADVQENYVSNPKTNQTTTTSSASGALASAATFKISQDWSGSNFMSGFDFFSYADPTHGQVNFLDSEDAYNKGLVTVTSSNTTILKTDDTSTLAYGANRNSIRITSKQTYAEGDLVIMDAVKMPYGPGLWPAFWSVGGDWPNGGEIDIVEQVHNSVQNQMTLHTSSGCTLTQPMAASGQVLVTDCNANVDGNVGCGVLDNSKNSFGSGFNAVAGGVFATHWASTGISIWHFARSDIPADITAGEPSMASWGTPTAFWSSDSCSMNHFGAQTIVFDITICGDWAGATFAQSGLSGTCESAVMNPLNFANAFFEVNYVKVFSPK